MGSGRNVILALKELHPERDLDKCLIGPINDSEFMVLENADNVACIEFVDEDDLIDGFRVLNPKHREVSLLATDHCFFTDNDQTKKCDFLLFDNVYFCFVELKLDVTRKASDKIHEAQEQLGETIIFFQDSFSQKSKRFFRLELEAFVAMKSHIYPKHLTGQQKRRVAFQDKYGVKFFEQDFKEFDK